MNIYLDIDGVILAAEIHPSLHAEEFIKYIVDNHKVIWLTTHCRNPGDDPVPMLARYFDEETVEYLKKIKPAYWEESKTEGIDFTKEFKWIDDDLFEFEKEELEKHNALDSFIKVNLYDDPEQLEKIMKEL